MSECVSGGGVRVYRSVVSECEVHGPSSAERVRASWAADLESHGASLKDCVHDSFKVAECAHPEPEACTFCLQEVGSSDYFKLI